MNKQGPLHPLVLLLAFAALLIVGCSSSSENVAITPPSVLTPAANPIEEGRRAAQNAFAAALATAGEPGTAAYEASVANAKAAYEAKMSALTPPGGTWASKTIMTETKVTSAPETFVTDLKTGKLIKVDSNEIAATASSDATAALSTVATGAAAEASKATAAVAATPIPLEPQPLAALLTETPATTVAAPTLPTPAITAPAIAAPAITAPVVAPPTLTMPALTSTAMSVPKVTSSTITTTANPAPAVTTKSTRTVTTSTSSRGGLSADASSDAFAAPIAGASVVSVQKPKPTEVLSLSDFRYNLPPEDSSFKRVEAIPFRHSPGYIDLSQPRPVPVASAPKTITAQSVPNVVTRTRATNVSKVTGPISASPANQPSFRNWSSWENLTPMGGLPQTMLFVTGEVLTANSRFVPVLREAPSTSSNGELLLDLELEAMNDIGNDVISYRIVRFEKEVSPGIYNSVVVRRNGTPAIRLDIRKLSR